MRDTDWKASQTEEERLLSWYKRLEQAAEELRRKEQEQHEQGARAAEAPPSPPARPDAAPPAGSPSATTATVSGAAATPRAPAPQSAAPATTAPTASASAGTAPAVSATATSAPAASTSAGPAISAQARRASPRVPRIPRRGPAATPDAPASEQVDAAVLQHLPPHIRDLLLAPERETAQRYYARPFKETRAQLIQRLLDPLLSLEETARLLNVCPMTVRRYTNRGILPHFRTAGDQRRFRLSDVLTFMEKRGPLAEGEDAGEASDGEQAKT